MRTARVIDLGKVDCPPLPLRTLRAELFTKYFLPAAVFFHSTWARIAGRRSRAASARRCLQAADEASRHDLMTHALLLSPHGSPAGVNPRMLFSEWGYYSGY